MSTRKEFAIELRKRFRAPSFYSEAQLLAAWDACMKDGSIEEFDDTPYSANRLFYEHLSVIVKDQTS